MSAILHRNRTGEGQFIDLGMMEATSTLTGDAFLEYTANGVTPGPLGNRHRSIAPHGIYATSDGWIALAAETDQQWTALAALVDDERLHAARFQAMTSRKAHEDELDAILEAWTRTLSAAECDAAARNAGVTSAIIRERGEVLDHPALASRGFGALVDFPEAGLHRAAGIPWVMETHQLEVTRPSPLFGEHTFEILAEILGTTEAEYRDLVERGVVDGDPTG